MIIPIFLLSMPMINHANLMPVPWTEVVIDDQFWKPRLEINREVTLMHGFKMLKQHGYESNFKRAAAREKGGFEGFVFQDSDVYKVLEAVAFSLASKPDEGLRNEFDRWVGLIESAQLDDGYVNTFFQLNGIEKRWTNLRDQHELYCAGHLIEAAVADYVGSGNTRLLTIAKKFANHIESRFGPNKKPGYPGHPEIELALIKLSDATGERKYFDLARHFVRQRGSHYFAAEHKTPEPEYNGAYWQDRVPIASLDVIEGHAVRAAYLLSAVADTVRATQDYDLEIMQKRVWENATQKRMYVTGGIGNSSANEGFTKDYELPNESAYQETCASIAMVLWNYRLGLLYGDTKYADYMERALYNGVLSGVSLDGKRFFYENPLASAGNHHRKEWYACACCPPNIARLLASLGGFAYAKNSDSLYVNLYIAGQVRTKIGDRNIEVKVQTKYPSDGKVVLTTNAPVGVSVRLRIPAWSSKTAVKIDGKLQHAKIENGYAIVPASRTIEINFEMNVVAIQSHPLVESNRGRVAFARGPIIFAFEQADQNVDLDRVFIPSETHFSVSSESKPGVPAIVADAYAVDHFRWPGGLYRNPSQPTKVRVKAIPYAFWDNRDAGRMAVWMPTSFPPTRDIGAEGDAKVSVSFESEIAQISGINDGEEPHSSDEQPGKLCHFWPHKGGTEWVQYSFEGPIQVSGMKVYFFDDTGRGECRLPATWHAEALIDGSWQRINADYETKPNAWNVVKFRPVSSTAFRLIIEMQRNWSAGVHEWKLIVGD